MKILKLSQHLTEQEDTELIKKEQLIGYVLKNFITDTSIVPYNDYSKSKGVKLYGPNFKSYSPNKYKWYNSDSNKYLVEIPQAQDFSKFIPDFFKCGTI